jgi:hypothetical protein
LTYWRNGSEKRSILPNEAKLLKFGQAMIEIEVRATYERKLELLLRLFDDRMERNNRGFERTTLRCSDDSKAAMFPMTVS